MGSLAGPGRRVSGRRLTSEASSFALGSGPASRQRAVWPAPTLPGSRFPRPPVLMAIENSRSVVNRAGPSPRPAEMQTPWRPLSPGPPSVSQAVLRSGSHTQEVVGNRKGCIQSFSSIRPPPRSREGTRLQEVLRLWSPFLPHHQIPLSGVSTGSCWVS